uniref:Uncharacterized protein n=1 Tax=Arundo donax TaxID=35708 RepID=A0A0A9GEY6_ARUDO
MSILLQKCLAPNYEAFLIFKIGTNHISSVHPKC